MRRTILAFALVGMGCRAILGLEEKELTSPTDGAAPIPEASTPLANDVPDADASTAPACDSGIACNGTCVDSNARENCGYCGHDCAGQCSEGRCIGQLVTDVHVLANDLVQSGQFLFYATSANGGRARRTDKKQGDDRVVAQGLADGIRLAVFEPWLYLALPGQSRIARVSTDGGAAETIAASQPGVTAIATDGTNVYFSRGTEVRSVPIDGGTAAKIGASIATPKDVLVDGTYVFYVAAEQPDRGLWRMTKAGTDAQRLRDAPIGAITADADAIYVHDNVASTIVRVAKADGGSTTLVSVNDVGGLAVDDDHVFWTTADGIVHRAGKRAAGGSVEDVAKAADGASSIVVGDNEVFWLAGANVFSARK